MCINDVTLGVAIIIASMGGGLLFCLSICLILWIRNKDGALPSICSKVLFRQRKLDDRNSKPSEIFAAEINVFPSISYSETGSEPCSPVSSLSISSPLTPYGGRSFKTFTDPSGRDRQEGQSAHKSNFLIPELPKTKKPRPTSLTLRQPSSTIPFAAPSSESGTSASPAELESLRSAESFFPFREHTSLASRGPVGLTDETLRMSDQKHKFKIGMVKINIKYICAEKMLQISLLRGFQLPPHIQFKEEDIYVKFSLTIGDVRIRRSKTLNLCSHEAGDEAVATFEHVATSQDLSQSSIVITLCKMMSLSAQGMVIGSAYVNLADLILSDAHSFDSGPLRLPLGDSNPHQMMFCGGYLNVAFSLLSEGSLLSFTDIRLSGLDLTKIYPQGNEHTNKVQMYLKIIMYESGEPVFWRRTPPVAVDVSCTEVALANEFVFKGATKGQAALQLILSVRLKTGKRGERCVLGNVYLSESWFRLQLSSTSPSILLLHLPLDH